MMSNDTYTNLTEAQKKELCDGFDRTTISASSIEEKTRKSLGLKDTDKVEFFRRRLEEFKEK